MSNLYEVQKELEQLIGSLNEKRAELISETNLLMCADSNPGKEVSPEITFSNCIDSAKRKINLYFAGEYETIADDLQRILTLVMDKDGVIC